MNKKHLISFIFIFTSLIFSSVGQTKKEMLQIRGKNLFNNAFYNGVLNKINGKSSEAYDLFSYCQSLDSTNSAVLYELGLLHLDNSQDSLARRYLKKAIATDSKNVYYNKTLLDLDKKTGNVDEALKISQDMNKMYPDKMEFIFSLYDLQMQKNDTLSALKTLDKIEEIIGFNDEITKRKVAILVTLNKKEEAIKTIRKILNKQPNNLDYNILLGELLLNNNQTKQAKETFEKLSEKFPASMKVNENLVRCYTISKDSISLKRYLSNLLDSKKISSEKKLSLLENINWILDIEEFLPSLVTNGAKDYLKKHDDYPELHLFLAKTLLRSKKKTGNDYKKEAELELKKYVELRPTVPEGWELLIQLNFENVNEKDAKEFVKKAYLYNKTYPLFIFFYAAIEQENKHYKDAISIIKKGIPYVQVDKRLLSKMYEIMGESYHELHDEAKAFECFKKSLSYDENNALTLNNYAYYLSLTNKDLSEAEKMSSKSVQLEPENSSFLDTYSWILYLQGSYDLAKIYMEKAIDLTPKEKINDVMWDHYGDILYHTGNIQEAIDNWKLALKASKDKKVIEKKIEKAKKELSKKETQPYEKNKN